jgi:AcrR family transcriptional regulator
MPRSLAKDHELRREEILEQAAALFAQRSFAAVSMADVAGACGASKARLYHYYTSKDALLFDLLDRYTQRLLVIVAETQARAQREDLADGASFRALVQALLAEYEHSANRHRCLTQDVKFLPDGLREQILNRQRDVVSAVARFLQRAYPARFAGAAREQLTPAVMMLFGMINWTFTWLQPGGRMSYAQYAELVVDTLDQGLNPLSKGMA